MFSLLWFFSIWIPILVTQSSAQAPNGDCYEEDQCAYLVPLCKRVTQPGQLMSVACVGDIGTITPYGDHTEIVGKCTCDDKWVTTWANIFLNATEELGLFITKDIEPVFHVLEDVGEALLGAVTLFIPGVGEVAEAALAAVMVSARVAEYTEGVVGGLAKFGESVASHAKTLGKTPADIKKYYDKARQLPDSLIYPKFSTGNLKPYKGGKDDDPGNPRPTHPEPTHPEPTHPEPTHPEPTHPEPTHPEPTHPDPTGPHNTRPPTRRPTSTHSNCKVRRAGKDHTVHSSVVERWIRAAKTNEIKEDCDAKKYPQACAHYYSAAVNYKHIGTKFECIDYHTDHKARDHLTATDNWDKGHVRDWRSFTRDDYQLNLVKANKPKDESPYCQMDEWPPAYFMPLAAKDNLHERSQMIRYLPGHENRGAALSWARFCNEYDGGPGNRMHKVGKGEDKREELNSGNQGFHLEPQDAKNVREEVNQCTTTRFSTWAEATWTRAAFELGFKWDGQGLDEPTDRNDWHLKENPCWPKDITPDDPGFVLLGNDNFYARANQNVKNLIAAYGSTPTQDRIDKANELRKRDGVDVVQMDGPPPPKKSRPNPRRARNRREIEILDDGFAIAENNSTRRLTNEEVRRDIEIIKCADNTCSKERAAMDDNEAYAIMPASTPRAVRLPLTVEAVATAVEVQVKTLETRTHARMTVSPDQPVSTGAMH